MELGHILSVICSIDSGPHTNFRSYYCYSELNREMGLEDQSSTLTMESRKVGARLANVLGSEKL